MKETATGCDIYIGNEVDQALLDKKITEEHVL
jgi:hypothetical protein